MATYFPEVDRVIKNPSSPVVLEMRGLSKERLLTERGGHDVEALIQLFFRLEAHPDSSVPANFRTREVTAADIVAVHDLRDWPADEVNDSRWRPDPAKVAAARWSAKDWLRYRARTLGSTTRLAPPSPVISVNSSVA